MDVLTTIREVISLEIKALNDLHDSIDDSFLAAIDLILKSPRKVIFSGMGKSGLIARKIAATFSSTGTTSIFLHPSEALHGDLGMVEPGDTIVLIGKSGESDEIIGILPVLKKLRCKLIAITANKESTLAKHSDVVLYTPIEKEACSLNLAPTASTTSALAVGDALAIALMQYKNFSRQDFALFHPGGRLGKRLLYMVDDLMKSGKDNPVVYLTDLFDTVIDTITRGGVNATSVIDQERHFKGLITGYDLRKAFRSTNDLRSLKAQDIMFTEPVTISAGVYAIEAFEKIKNNPKPLLLLPVLDKDQKSVGIITMQAMIRAGL
jgi:arabinose-5-phosphate isomerase